MVASSGKAILVIGGAGLVGTPIVQELDRAGWHVRVMGRHASGARPRLGARVELVSGDATQSAELERAMSGVDAVLVCVSDLLDPYLDLKVTRNVVALAPRMRVGRIGLISGPTVAEERRSFPLIDSKWQAETCLEASGIPWVIIRPTWPMESLARFVRGNKASILGRQPATIHPVAGSDLGRMVRRAFELDDAVGRTFVVHGPEARTMDEWLAAYCALTQPKARVQHVPFWILRTVAAITRDKMLAAAVELMRYFEHQPERGDPTEANRILGAPTLTLADWAARTLPSAGPSAGEPHGVSA